MHTWLVEIDREPYLEAPEPNYKFITRGIGNVSTMPGKMIITFLENERERKVFRREILFEKTRTLSIKLRSDSEFIITLSRIHLFVGKNHFNIDPFTNNNFKLYKVLDDSIIIKSWILSDVYISDSSFYLDPTITNIEHQKITIIPTSIWDV